MSEASARQARAQVDSIVELVAGLNGEHDDEARQDIYEDALSVEVRANQWQAIGPELEADEFRIVLCTGGPHVEIRGDLNDFNEPERVGVFHQDWFESFEELALTSQQEEAVLKYARCFYFGE